jgi:hypothetical protein
MSCTHPLSPTCIVGWNPLVAMARWRRGAYAYYLRILRELSPRLTPSTLSKVNASLLPALLHVALLGVPWIMYSVFNMRWTLNACVGCRYMLPRLYTSYWVRNTRIDMYAGLFSVSLVRISFLGVVKEWRPCSRMMRNRYLCQLIAKLHWHLVARGSLFLFIVLAW